jgi:hypothetical protein
MATSLPFCTLCHGGVELSSYNASDSGITGINKSTMVG